MPAKDSEEREGEGCLAPTTLMARPSLANMYTLPEDIRPSNYNITVCFDIPAREFRCSVETRLTLDLPSSTVFLNSQNLELSNIRLSCPKTGTEVQGSVTEREDTMGVVRMDFQQEVGAGEKLLSLDCRGAIRPGLQGVYLNKFTDLSGRERDGVSTMFAATEARYPSSSASTLRLAARERSARPRRTSV